MMIFALLMTDAVSVKRLVSVVTILVLLTNYLSLVSSFSPPARSYTTRASRLLSTTDNSPSITDAITSFFSPGSNNIFGKADTASSDAKQFVRDFVSTVNQGQVRQAVDEYLDPECEYTDATFYGKLQGCDQIERKLRLQQAVDYPVIAIDDMSSSDDGSRVGILYHLEKQLKNTKQAEPIDNGRGVAFFVIKNEDGINKKIQSVFITKESSIKPGENGLKVLTVVSKFISATKSGRSQPTMPSDTNDSVLETAPENFFASWNKRDMDSAANSFAPDSDGFVVNYDDTAFPKPLRGIKQVKEHLYKCADAFPSTFSFVVDDIVKGKEALTVRWHVENGGDLMPFTQGCSFYNINDKGLITKGIDFVEPGPVKTGFIKLFGKTTAKLVTSEPVRLVPIASWIAYMYIVFLSDNILPGANALELEQRTWEEVLNLSLNFFLVAPLLNLPFSPTVHPMLEGVFNLLLSWAAMFAGFLSDDRRDKPNILPMVPIVVGMQFLTSAFLLPYLGWRSSEENTAVTKQDLSTPARICESRLLGPAMGIVGSGAIVWGFVGRPEFGGLLTRYSSFVDLLSIDRVGSSFLVDLAIFALFQGWLVDDDLKRRSTCPDWIVKAGKYVPFFGMVVYLALRPGIADAKEQ